MSDILVDARVGSREYSITSFGEHEVRAASGSLWCFWGWGEGLKRGMQWGLREGAECLAPLSTSQIFVCVSVHFPELCIIQPKLSEGAVDS